MIFLKDPKSALANSGLPIQGVSRLELVIVEGQLMTGYCRSLLLCVLIKSDDRWTAAEHLDRQVQFVCAAPHCTKQRSTLSRNTPGTLAIWLEYGCEDSRKFVSGTPPKLVNWLARLVN